MKPERAQELYSDYAEGTLAPALRQALEQHFDTEPAARADYARFARIYTLLEQPLEAESEVPPGFRANILEQVAAGQARRETTFTTRGAGTATGGWFSTVPHRRMTGGALAGLAAAALIGVLFIHPNPKTTNDSSFVPSLSSSGVPMDPAVIQKVDLEAGAGNNSYQAFHLHLPPSVPAAMVSAYVATEQVTDPARLREETPALPPEHLTNHQGISIPIAATVSPPVGATLNLLVQWTPDDPKLEPGAEVVFRPFGPASPATAAPANANFLDAMQAVASHYGATVVVDADAVPTQTVSDNFAAPDAGSSLQAMAKSAGYSVQTLPDNTFYVYDPKS